MNLALTSYFKKHTFEITFNTILFLSGYASLLFFPTYIIPLCAEDSLIENLSALFLIGSVVFLFMAFLKIRRQSFLAPKNTYLLSGWLIFLCLVFLFAFGEEINWGQRILNFDTPSKISERNIQREFNFHNLESWHGRYADGKLKTGLESFFTMHAIFYTCLFAYTLILPVLVLYIKKISILVQRIGIPIAPTWTGLIILIATIFAKTTKFFFTGGDWALTHGVVEIKEMFISLGIMLLSIQLFKRPQGYPISTE